MPPQLQPADEWVVVNNDADEWEVVPDDAPSAPIRPMASHAPTASDHPLGQVGEDYEMFPGAVAAFGRNLVKGLSSRLSTLRDTAGLSTSEKMAAGEARGPSTTLDAVTRLGTAVPSMVLGGVKSLAENVTQPTRYLEDPVRVLEDAGTAAGLGTVGKLGARAVSATLKPAAKSTAKWMMRSSIKGGIDEAGATTLLDEQIRPGDVVAFKSRTGELSNEVGRLVDDATTAGTTVDRRAVVRGAVQKLRSDKRLRETEIDPAWPRQAGARVREVASGANFRDPVTGTWKTSTPRSLQDFKVGLQQKLDSAYDARAPLTGATDADMQLAAAARAELERVVPEVGPVNARLGRLRDVADQFERAANREGSRDIGGNVRAITGAALGGSPVQRFALGQASNLIQSNMGRMSLPLYRYGKRPTAPVVPSDALRLALLAALSQNQEPE